MKTVLGSTNGCSKLISTLNNTAICGMSRQDWSKTYGIRGTTRCRSISVVWQWPQCCWIKEVETLLNYLTENKCILYSYKYIVNIYVQTEIYYLVQTVLNLYYLIRSLTLERETRSLRKCPLASLVNSFSKSLRSFLYNSRISIISALVLDASISIRA